MDKVWIVSTGEYSDWRIQRIFSNKEAADEYAKTFEVRHWSGADIHEWDVDSAFDKDSIFWEVTFWQEGQSLSHSAEREEELPDDAMLGRVAYDDYRVNRYAPLDEQRWVVWVRMPTEQGALKAAAEYVDQFRAEQEGIA